MERVENSAGHEASHTEMTKRRTDRTVVIPERKVLRALIHECDAFIHWANWSHPTERSERSITQMMEIIKGVALKGLRKKRA